MRSNFTMVKDWTDMMNMSCAVEDWDMADFWEDFLVDYWNPQ